MYSMTSKSAPILWELIGHLADVCLTIRVSGESGMGKEAIARLIHRHYPHPDARFLKHDFRNSHVKSSDTERRCQSAATDRLISSMASPQKKVFYFVHIEEMPTDVQDRLHCMMEQQFQSMPPWILTSNDQPLQPHLVSGRLNRKLIERLDTIHIHIPPLRERPERIPQILTWYLNRTDDDTSHGLPSMPDESTMKRLKNYHWPGNLHQLRHIAHRAIKRQQWDTVLNTLETRSVQSTDIVDEMAAIFILSLSEIRICKEMVLEGLIASSHMTDVGLLDLAILDEVACQFADRISMPMEKERRYED
jgi:DNA-binding NtrC family response regulator